MLFDMILSYSRLSSVCRISAVVFRASPQISTLSFVYKESECGEFSGRVADSEVRPQGSHSSNEALLHTWVLLAFQLLTLYNQQHQPLIGTWGSWPKNKTGNISITWDLPDIQIPGFYSRLTDSATLQVRPRNLFEKLSRGF